MKKFIFICLAVTLIFGALTACRENADAEIIGSWYTEKNGVGMTVTFTAEGEMQVVCKIADKQLAEKAGVKQDIIEAKNITCVYGVESTPDLSGLSEYEKNILSGKKALHRYKSSEEKSKKAAPYETIYFVLENDTLVTTQKTGEYQKMTGESIYSETIFSRVN